MSTDNKNDPRLDEVLGSGDLQALPRVADKKNEPGLDELADAPPPSLVVELFDFLKYNKKWWLMPILLMLGLFGILMALAATGAAPFIYTLF